MDVNGIKYELYPNVSMISSSIGNGIVGSRYINRLDCCCCGILFGVYLYSHVLV